MSFDFKVMNNSINQKVPALYLHFDQKKFLINFPDLHQRYLPNHSIKICENTQLLVTGSEMDYNAGLQGILCNLILRNLSRPINIYVPGKVFDYLQSFKFIFGRKFLHYSITAIDDPNKYQLGARNKMIEEMNPSLKTFFDWNLTQWDDS